MKIGIQKVVEVEAKEIRLCCKVRDCFSAGIYGQDGEEIFDYEGYVPDFFPGNHYGDYLELNIDLETGRITNWNKPSEEDIQKFINEGENDSR